MFHCLIDVKLLTGVAETPVVESMRMYLLAGSVFVAKSAILTGHLHPPKTNFVGPVCHILLFS